jgi:hypothetical protein
MGIFSFLFNSKETKIKAEHLYGDWDAVSLNGEALSKHGFSSIKIKITSDTIRIITKMNTFGDFTTISEGNWELNDKIFISKIGDGEKQSRLRFYGTRLIFTPDPLFKSETVSKSEYSKIG